MKTIRVKNCQTISDTYCGRTIEAGEYYIIQENEWVNFKCDGKLLAHINPEVNNPVKALINDGTNDLSWPNGFSWLQDTNIQEVIGEVTPTAPKNEYSLRPYGLGHKHIDASAQVYDITLSNKDEKDIDYSGCGTTPQFYDCIFQNHSEIRDGVLSVNGSTITTFMGRLQEGAAKLSRPVPVDYKIETMEQVQAIYMWGVYASCEGYGEDDIMRLQICDPYGVGVGILYTQEELEAMGYIVEEYDECWAGHVAKLVEFNTPDGSPGEIMVGMVVRALFYPKDPTKTNIRVWTDYKMTIKDG